MGFIRAFIAIEIPPQMRDELYQQTARLRERIGGDIVRWAPVESLHITLKFLGDIPEAHLNFIKQSLIQTADSSASFEFSINRFGSFPDLNRPRVLWAGIDAPAGMASLQQMIEEAMARLGYEKEKRGFSPHLTLGRVRPNASPAEIKIVRSAIENVRVGKISKAGVDSVHLYKSDLQPGGSVYTKIHSAALRRPSSR